MKKTKIVLRDIPEDTVQKIGRAILSYSTPILGLKTSDPNEQPTLLGSATLVQYGNDKGLLTAEHVYTKGDFKDCESIGLIISEKEHRFKISRQYLQVNISKPDSTLYGPDLAFIKIPDLDASTISSQKGFWQMDAYTKKASKELEKRNFGVWVIFGCPSLYKRLESSNSCFEKTFVPGGLIAMSSKPSFFSKNTYDYFDVQAFYDDDNDLPESFAGVSGGGLWHIPLEFTNSNETIEIQVPHPTLMGVVHSHLKCNSFL